MTRRHPLHFRRWGRLTLGPITTVPTNVNMPTPKRSPYRPLHSRTTVTLLTAGLATTTFNTALLWMTNIYTHPHTTMSSCQSVCTLGFPPILPPPRTCNTLPVSIFCCNPGTYILDFYFLKFYFVQRLKLFSLYF